MQCTTKMLFHTTIIFNASKALVMRLLKATEAKNHDESLRHKASTVTRGPIGDFAVIFVLEANTPLAHLLYKLRSAQPHWSYIYLERRCSPMSKHTHLILLPNTLPTKSATLTMVNGQIAFRVKLTAPVQCSTASTSARSKDNAVVHSRKAHNKSRNGCLPCKRRRKKVTTLIY